MCFVSIAPWSCRRGVCVRACIAFEPLARTPHPFCVFGGWFPFTLSHDNRSHRTIFCNVDDAVASADACRLCRIDRWCRRITGAYRCAVDEHAWLLREPTAFKACLCIRVLCWGECTKCLVCPRITAFALMSSRRTFARLGNHSQHGWRCCYPRKALEFCFPCCGVLIGWLTDTY